MNREQRIASDRRKIAAVCWVITPIAIIGFVVKPQYDVLWAFALSFSIATLPRWVWRRIRTRREQINSE